MPSKRAVKDGRNDKELNINNNNKELRERERGREGEQRNWKRSMLINIENESTCKLVRNLRMRIQQGSGSRQSGASSSSGCSAARSAITVSE